MPIRIKPSSKNGAVTPIHDLPSILLSTVLSFSIHVVGMPLTEVDAADASHRAFHFRYGPSMMRHDYAVSSSVVDDPAGIGETWAGCADAAEEWEKAWLASLTVPTSGAELP